MSYFKAENNSTLSFIKNVQHYLHRAQHWCLPHCPGQVEFVNYSCRASENYILFATGEEHFVYFRFTFENVCKFCGLPSKLVLENILSHARTMFYMVLNEKL